MKTSIHQQITTLALKDELSPQALQVVIHANLRQDSWWAQLGWHDHYHMDNSAFSAGNAYISRLHQQSIQYIKLAGSAPRMRTQQVYQKLALEALGKLTHTAQDFYAHSNYCALWMSQSTTPREPNEINPMDTVILGDPSLKSGKGSLLEVFSFLIPALAPMAERKLGPDSHMHMNLDHPGRGSLYPYAFAAAITRTQIEYHQLITDIDPDQRWLLSGKK